MGLVLPGGTVGAAEGMVGKAGIAGTAGPPCLCPTVTPSTSSSSWLLAEGCVVVDELPNQSNTPPLAAEPADTVVCGAAVDEVTGGIGIGMPNGSSLSARDLPPPLTGLEKVWAGRACGMLHPDPDRLPLSRSCRGGGIGGNGGCCCGCGCGCGCVWVGSIAPQCGGCCCGNSYVGRWKGGEQTICIYVVSWEDVRQITCCCCCCCCCRAGSMGWR